MSLHILPTPKKIIYFQKEYLYDGQTVHTKIDSLLNREQYVLEITAENGISIIGGSEQAVFYGECTLEQIMHQTGNKLPTLKLEDEPAFDYRGFMIDCARHFFSLDELKAIVDTMAKLKFNKFHWHLTDDQGFRMEIRSLEKLHKEGSVRSGSYFGKMREPAEYGGYYTREDMEEMVRFCAERYIDIIPEIDIPGHSTAMVHAYPEISCTGKKVPVETKQGIFKNILCAGNELTFEYIVKVLDEMCEIFPGEYFHLGGDEVPKYNWKHCCACTRVLHENALKNYHELQGWMMNRIGEHLQEKGKKVICWNDALKAKNLNSAFVIERWLDLKKNALRRANEGGKIIMADSSHHYFNNPYANVPLKKAFAYKPYLNGMSESGKENIWGVECCIWTEYIPANEVLEYMLFPRACAAAETAWANPKSSYQDFEGAVENFSFVFRDNHIHPAPKSDWNPLPHRRVFGTLKFFSSIIPHKD